MDDDAETFRGYRRKWRKVESQSHSGATIFARDDANDMHDTNSDVPAIELPPLFPGFPFVQPSLDGSDIDVTQENEPVVVSPVETPPAFEQTEDGNFLRGLVPVQVSPYEPSSPQTQNARVLTPVDDDDVILDVGGRSSVADDDAAISDMYITGVTHSGFKMPWETPLMKQIFGDDFPKATIHMPMDWGSTDLPNANSSADDPPKRLIPAGCNWTCSRHIKYCSDENFVEQRQKTMNLALTKWRFLIMLDPALSEAGRAMQGGDEKLILESIIGVKSPGTILKRANSLLMFYRWHTCNCDGPFLPFKEGDAWHYVISNASAGASATRSQSFAQAMRFAWRIMGFDGASECASSRRINGQSQIQLSSKGPTRQARPLTVVEMRRLHAISEDKSYSVVDRCIVSNMLFAVYGRCRISDMNHVHEILHDSASGSGFVEVTTVHHKGARSAQQKALLMPIVLSGAGVNDLDWVAAWVANRRAAGLPVSGCVDGALCPAPMVSDSVGWLRRPLTASEFTDILKSLLETADENLSSHSLKATCLSWAAKAEIPKEQRRILGRHSSVAQESDSFYSRDLSYGPVNLLRKVILLIQQGSFCPDGPRSTYFPHGNPLCSGTPARIVMEPFTPAFAPKADSIDSFASAVPGVHVPATPAQEAPPIGGAVKSEDERDANLVDQHEGPILIEPDTDEDSDDSDSFHFETDSEQAVDDACEEPPAVPEMPSYSVLLRNKRTRVIHEAKEQILFEVKDTAELLSTVGGSVTVCGRIIDHRCELVPGLHNWTDRCRVCFKGRRNS